MSFPPVGPTTIQNIIKSYLYTEYSDDDDLQALVAAYNNLAQQFLDWFNGTPLSVYTSPNVSELLLDWVAEGVYGLERPYLPYGLSPVIGPYNTAQFNQIGFNQIKSVTGDIITRTGGIGFFIIGTTPIGGTTVVTPISTYYLTDDNTFKRILTWYFFKGDGKAFTVRWLKRRIMRFLFGPDGVNFNVDQTYQISVTIAPGQININIITSKLTLDSGTFNTLAFNAPVPFNAITSTFMQYPSIPEAPIFKAAVDAGVLEFPFQYDVVVGV